MEGDPSADSPNWLAARPSHVVVGDLSCGGRGIRTPGDLRLKAFQVRAWLWLEWAGGCFIRAFGVALSPGSALAGWRRLGIMARSMARRGAQTKWPKTAIDGSGELSRDSRNAIRLANSSS